MIVDRALQPMTSKGEGITILSNVTPDFAKILTPDALDFIAQLARTFEPQRQALLQRRQQRQAMLNTGELPGFLPETAHIRAGEWIIHPIPEDIRDRRVEITGPVDRKIIINALNSGARVFMADFEDAHSPTWRGTIQGQINLYDAIRHRITYTSQAGKSYTLHEQTATLFVRPRGWHLTEKHVLIDGQQISASLFDFGLYFYHNARQLIENGTAPYFYLPKLEGHLEARLWNQIFISAQKTLDIPRATIKATVLIETILAAFEMDEILYELREHSAGLNCGRWDYIFSTIKKFRTRPDFLLPNRESVTMGTPFMRAYSLLTIKTCHRRHAQAIGGMAAQIPIKDDLSANEEALLRVRSDKRREATDGHDGTWVAHPGLVQIAKEEFDAHMSGPNQIDRKREDIYITTANLLQVPEGRINESGLRNNIGISLRYLESWFRGSGCVPINNLMEDIATVEIARAQLWQWIHHAEGILNDGRNVTVALFRQILGEEEQKLIESIAINQHVARRIAIASTILERIVCDDEFIDFLTIPAYQYID